MVTSYESVLYEKKNGIAYITLNRPRNFNAMNRQLSRELAQAWADFDGDDDLNVAILTGAGRVFCAGLDMREAAQSLGQGASEREVVTGVEFTPKASETLKPKICAVNGPAVGGGISLMLSCDIILCSPNAHFAMLFVARGHPAGAMAVQLARKTSVGAAMWMSLTAQRIDAQTALRWGLVQEVVPAEELMPRATQLAEMICANSQLAVMATKERLLKTMELPYKEAMAYIGPVERTSLRTPDFQEGVRAYTEKRKAQF